MAKKAKSSPSFHHLTTTMSEEICPKCGTENVTKAAWCEKCLHMFHEYGEKQTILCPECKHTNAYKDDYCEVCHEPLKPGQWE